MYSLRNVTFDGPVINDDGRYEKRLLDVQIKGIPGFRDAQIRISNHVVIKFRKNETDRTTSNVFTVKFHQNITVVLTPLLLNALERYIDSFKSLSACYHLSSVLDTVHLHSILKAKDKFLEKNATEILTQTASWDTIKTKLNKNFPVTSNFASVELPSLKLLFYQVSTETYNPSENPSLSGQCGSEYSVNLDINNSDSVLLGAYISDMSFKLQQRSEHDSLFNAISGMLFKSQQSQKSINQASADKIVGIIDPNNLVCETTVDSLQCQVLYLESKTEEKELHITSLPQSRSNVNFKVKRGGNLFVDNESVNDGIDSEESLLGSIILEIGIEEITFDGSYEKRVSPKYYDRNKFSNESIRSHKRDYSAIEIESTVKEEKDKYDGVGFSKSSYRQFSNSDSTISSNEHVHRQFQTTRKGYVALDIDSGEMADASDNDENDEKSSLLNEKHWPESKVPLENVDHCNVETKTSSPINQIVTGWEIAVSAKAKTAVKKAWTSVAAPLHLRTHHSESDQDVDLVAVLVPALGCWVPSLISTANTITSVTEISKKWKSSVFGSLMGQALPEQGRLLKKHITSSASTSQSRFLQEECSSQLVCLLRRQTYGHRLNNLKVSLQKNTFIPPLDDLEKGIHALIRQWKCIIIGVEADNAALTSAFVGYKKPVVGRGVLTQKDFEILMKDSETKGSGGSFSRRLTSPGNPISKLEIVSPHRVEYHKGTANVEVESATESEGSDNENVSSARRSDKAKSPRNEESLYDWMSKSPVNSNYRSSPVKSLNLDQMESNIDEGSYVDYPMSYRSFRSTTPMVSVPTSGMQLADAAEVFSPLLDILKIKFPKNELGNTFTFNKNIKVIDFTVNVIATETDENLKKSQTKVTIPALSLKNFTSIIQMNMINEQGLKPEKPRQEVILQSYLHEAHFHINFALVRLILQTHETFKVVREQKQYAEKSSRSHNATHPFQWEYLYTALSDPAVDIPKCWRNMYNVMTLYELLPKSKSDLPQEMGSPSSLARHKSVDHLRASQPHLKLNDGVYHTKTHSRDQHTSMHIRALPKTITELSVLGTTMLKKIVVTASISGMEFDFEVTKLNATVLKESKKTIIENFTSFDDMASCSLHVDKARIKLMESVKATSDAYENDQPDLRASRTLVTCKIYNSHGLHTIQEKRPAKASQKSLLCIGPIAVEIPQHPGALRSISTQFSKRIQTHFTEFDDYCQSKRGLVTDEVGDAVDLHSLEESLASNYASASFRMISSDILVSAVLLPSLRAEYKIEGINGWGNFNKKVKFFFNLPQHGLSFNTKVMVVPLPPTTHITLPPVKVQGHYLELSQQRNDGDMSSTAKSHGYLHVSVDIGRLEQNLTTDLLNHLIFLQKGFIKEVNDVVADVENNEPLPLWRYTSIDQTSSFPMIYSVQLRVKGIEINATTPSSNGIQLETGEITVEVSNQSPSSSVLNIPEKIQTSVAGGHCGCAFEGFREPKLYGKAQVQVNISLGQFVKEAVNDQQLNVYANFGTLLSMTNSLKDKESYDSNKETVMVTLGRPQLYVMPAAVDKGVAVYLHYKNAYDYWMEQRLTLSNEYPAVAEHIWSRLSQPQSIETFTKYLFFQLNVHNIGICLPLKEQANVKLGTSVNTNGLYDDKNPAVVITIYETSITCCNSGAFVSAGLFQKFCLRFSDDFDYTAETWKIDDCDFMNTYSIPEGTYNLCSRTDASSNSKNEQDVQGKWVMNVLWRMCGVNIHVDTNIGNRLSLLANALTAITGESDVADLGSLVEVDEENEFEDSQFGVHDFVGDNSFQNEEGKDMVDGTSQYPFEDTSLEKQLLLQTRAVNQLKRNNAHPDVISREIKVLQEIEQALTSEFFKDVRKRFKRKSKISTKHTPSRRRSISHARQRSFFLQPEPKLERCFSANDALAQNPDIVIETCDTVDGAFTVPNSSNNVNLNKDLPDKHRVQFSESTDDFTARKMKERPKAANSSTTAVALDFELDIVVDIESGKCMMHLPSSQATDDEVNVSSTKKQTNRKVSDQTDMISKRVLPFNSKRSRLLRSASGALSSPSNQVHSEQTVILLPGVNVSVNYVSVNTVVDKVKFIAADHDRSSDTSSMHSQGVKQLNKSASVNAFVAIQSLPKEMVVRPSLLDFLEKALEPIIQANDTEDGFSENVSSLNGTGSLVSSGSELYSFPVDVIAFIRIQPSDILFSCQPISKVECLVKIPSLDFAITNTPSSSNSQTSRKKTPLSKKNSASSKPYDVDSVSDAGFAFTACLSQFVFCIFHPYGKQYGGIGVESRGYSNSKFNFTQQAISGKKDSLSLNVQFLKFNLHRKVIKKTTESSDKTVVKISALCDIGSAVFNYDMRRLNEILDVPKAWYKRGLMQRVFLGKEATFATSQSSTHQTKRSQSDSEPPTEPEDLGTPKLARKTVHTHRRSGSTGAAFFGSFMASPFSTPRSGTVGSRQDLMFKFDGAKKSKRNAISKEADTDCTDGPTTSVASSVSQWETNIVVAFNVSSVDVYSNMGNVMGQATWSTNDLCTTTNLSLDNSGLNKGSVTVSVRQGTFDAHGGVIGGYIELQGVSAAGCFGDTIDSVPEHHATVSLRCGEIRIDYMGSSIVMATLTSFTTKLEDTWNIGKVNKNLHVIPFLRDGGASDGERTLKIQVNCDASWDELQIILSRSTSVDFVKMIGKLEDFLNQQQRSSLRALSSLRRPSDNYKYGGRTRTNSVLSSQEHCELRETLAEKEGLKYQHWIELVNGIPHINLDNLTGGSILEKNIHLSGRLNLSGSYVSLACFHGANFRSQNWALFTLREPTLSFTSHTNVYEKSCQVMRAISVQNAVVMLGRADKKQNDVNNPTETNMDFNVDDFMVTVRKVSRGRRNPPALGATVQEWLLFVNTISDKDFPSLKTSRSEGGEKLAHTKYTGGLRRVTFASKYRYENDSELIFALPKLKIELKNEHDLPMTSSISKRLSSQNITKEIEAFRTLSNKHVVNTSFLSHFDESINVTMDVGLLFYLHDLILSYMKEKESASTSSTSRAVRLKSTVEGNDETTEEKSEISIKKEEKYREFRVKNWKLEPRIRLLSWAGKRMDPVNIDWVLEKLGFMHAALTIPKWVQRGALDPMDFTLATMMEHMLAYLKEKRKVESENVAD